MLAENSHLISKMREQEVGLPNTYVLSSTSQYAFWIFTKSEGDRST